VTRTSLYSQIILALSVPDQVIPEACCVH